MTTLADLIAAAVTSIGSVSLVPTGDTAQFVESITPASYGPLPGDVEHVLTFEVTWVGVKDCREHDQVFTGTIDVVADGVVVAQKRVRVTVPAVPVPLLGRVRLRASRRAASPDPSCRASTRRP